MNRKERKSRGIKGKQGDRAIVHQAVSLARELSAKGKSADSLKLYRKILDFDPDNPIALLDVGIDAYLGGKHAQAETMFNKVLQQEPKNVGALVMLASVRMDQNRVEESLRLIQKAERNDPPRKLMTRLGVLYRDAGQLERAKDYIAKALEANPEDITAYYTLQTLKKYTPEDLDVMDRISRKEGISLDDKIRLEFAMGKACLDTGKADPAFWHFAEANLLKRAGYKFNIKMLEEYFASIARLFSAEFIEKMRGKVKNKGRNQIFIVGMPRSGSTLVDQILSSHPEVTSVGEAKFLSASMPLYRNAEVHAYSSAATPTITQQFIDDCSAEMLEAIGDKYLTQVEPFTKHQRIVVDKMLFNFAWLGAIRLALPEAKIVHCQRDPVDIGLSIWQLLFSDDIPWAYDQKEIGRYYLAYSGLMEHWRQVFPGEFLDVNYEDVVADQEGQTRRLLEFCGLPWHDDCLRFHENKRQVKTASVTQVRQPIYKDSVKKWKKYEKHLTRLVDAVEGKPDEAPEMPA